ncbi:MAG: hypothetical protein K2Q18_12355 [Bdellovibrionales bacterium]|nr:hypothetical protein [Bdellovibrionales bacterium]
MQNKIKKMAFIKARLFLTIFLLFSFNVFADTKIPSQLSFCIGSFSGSFSENEDNLKSTDGTSSSKAAPYSGTATSMPLEIGFEYFPNLKRSYFIKGSGPLVGSTPDRYFSVTSGVNFYFAQIGSEAKVSDFNFEMKIVPKFRYYAGPSVGIGYLVYNTTSATKNDLLFEIGLQGGVAYALSSKWGLKAEVGAARAIGVLVSSTIIKITLGITTPIVF